MKNLVKIGIRPTIDGRRLGVRESLEDQTMNMANNLAKFITENVRHVSGEAVECVIADTTIGGVAEASACAEKFKRENVGVSITVNALLVLRHSNAGYGSTFTKSDLGFQWY